MHVEVDATESRLSFEDVIGVDVGVPHRGLGGFAVGEAEHLRGDVEHALLHPAVFEVRANGL